MFVRSLRSSRVGPIMKFSNRTLSTTVPPVVALPAGSLIEVSGVDTYKFLQGLCTNDVTNLKSNHAMAAAFLTAKGRIFANTIMYDLSDASSNATTPTVVLEVDSCTPDEFVRYLKLYKLRSKVTIKPLDWRCHFTPKERAGDSDLPAEPIFEVVDPRLSGFGVRSLVKGGPDDSGAPTQAATLAWYERYKLVHGIADGPAVHNRIPLECNLDLLNYISFAKGCYVGQELTARTKYKGLVRKRLVPFLFASKAEFTATDNKGNFEPLSTTEKATVTCTKYAPTPAHSVVAVGSRIYTDRESTKSVGEVIQLDSTGTVGVAMVQLAVLDNRSGNFVVRAPAATAGAGAAGEEEDGPQQAETPSPSDEVSYISTFRPDWFTGLDAKTGNLVESN